MRRRSTFIHKPEHAINPDDIVIVNQTLHFSGLRAAREERFTFGINDLPDQVRDLLTRSGSIRIRWTSQHRYGPVSPFLARSAAGLFVEFTPQEHRPNDEICVLLKTLFSYNLKCNGASQSFVSAESPLSSSKTVGHSQYYSLLPNLTQFVEFVGRTACDSESTACIQDIELLRYVSYIDIDYDGLSHNCLLTAFWEDNMNQALWDVTIKNEVLAKSEIGILSTAPANEPEDLQLEGFLIDLSQHDEPKPTIFFFPSRHHELSAQQSQEQAYHVSFDTPAGLHPTLRISFAGRSLLNEPAKVPSGSACTLYTYVTLPSFLFADEYAFPTLEPDNLFQEAHGIVSLKAISGEKDLELPDYAIERWGSTLLLELDSKLSSPKTSGDIKIPLHFRYMNSTIGGEEAVQVPWPVLFWACSSDESIDLRGNPFDRTHLGHDTMFGDDTIFYYLQPDTHARDQATESITIPVLDTNHVSYAIVEQATLLVVVAGFCYLAVRILLGIISECNWWKTVSSSRSSEDKKST
ncbi:hypothetical protein BT93_L5129 [Corymbia citriodora subsp. variegata]|uniref:Protein PBN1 n=1 Tax=Corymbia citriodora subsp. variegata TaxID=360336 RepID=A0A8T0CFA1_CORYI|nr:hypothetical protein BT93_L5129 [Corymbia citriodora subsp. variegata]